MKKENLPVIIAIALPVLLVLAVTLSVYLPNAGSRPQYDFLYMDAVRSYTPYSYVDNQCIIYKNYYEIENGRLLKKSYTLATSTADEADVKGGIRRGSPEEEARAQEAYCYGYMKVVRKDFPDLYIYRPSSDTSSIISYEDASKLTLVDGIISPDSYSISAGYRSSGIFDIFDGGGSYELAAVKKNQRVRLSVPETDLYGNRDFRFIAWVSH